MSGPPNSSGQPRPRHVRLDEDWAATILGLVLLIAVLIGLIPEGVIP